jgi:hypothetical protein
MQEVILSTAYLGPIQYFTKFLLASWVKIEQYDTYQKQTYRNRCRILGANGPLDLTIPVIKTFGNHTMVKDIRIDYTTRWQINHWRSICSAYNSSPFLEYYIDDFQPFYHRKCDFLMDFNQQLLEVVLELLELDLTVDLTDAFEKEYLQSRDFRNTIQPKTAKEFLDGAFLPYEYTQTFSERLSFSPNLSVIDLLFNQGPEAIVTLKRSLNQEEEIV